MNFFGRSGSAIGGPGGHMRVFFGSGPGGPGGFFAVFVVLLLLALAVVLIVTFIRHEKVRRRWGPVAAGGAPASYEALRILNERFARGDIEAEDYEVRRDLLRGSEKP